LDHDADQYCSYILRKAASSLENKDSIDQFFAFDKHIFILESIRLKAIVGFGYKANEWVAFANMPSEVIADIGIT